MFAVYHIRKQNQYIGLFAASGAISAPKKCWTTPGNACSPIQYKRQPGTKSRPELPPINQIYKPSYHFRTRLVPGCDFFAERLDECPYQFLQVLVVFRQRLEEQSRRLFLAQTGNRHMGACTEGKSPDGSRRRSPRFDSLRRRRPPIELPCPANEAPNRKHTPGTHPGRALQE